MLQACAVRHTGCDHRHHLLIKLLSKVCCDFLCCCLCLLSIHSLPMRAASISINNAVTRVEQRAETDTNQKTVERTFSSPMVSSMAVLGSMRCM